MNLPSCARALALASAGFLKRSDMLASYGDIIDNEFAKGQEFAGALRPDRRMQLCPNLD